jgi:hypothetical protein
MYPLLNKFDIGRKIQFKKEKSMHIVMTSQVNESFMNPFK